MTSRILGLVREQVLAALFGAGNAMDAYNVAFRIPNLLRDLFAEGAMSAAFVPTFTRHLTDRGKDVGVAARQPRHQRAASSITGVLVLLGIVFAEPLVPLFAASTTPTSPASWSSPFSSTRIMLPFLTLVALAAALMGMLNSLHHFFIPALSPAMFNVVHDRLRVRARAADAARSACQPITAIAIGTLLGGVAQLALQWPTLRREGFRYQPGTRLDATRACGACSC